MADRVGQQLGNYRLDRLLGQGGFAEVYLGEHIYLGTQAAIKVLRTELDSDEIEHFLAEARTIARLVHPHIVRVLEFGVDNTIPFLVVDYAPNGTLRKRHARGAPLALSTVVDYVRQIADALQYAHDQKVIHRDVKPENMLLGRRNEVLLSDFGIALVTSSQYHSTRDAQAQSLVGTIAYMAPEQIQAEAFPASDQYSLGVVVYEWLTGTRPFQGSFTEIAVKHALAAPPPLRQKIPGVSAEVELVVLRALAKDPHQRFPTIRDFAVALEQASLRESSASSSVAESASSEEPDASLETVPFTLENASPPASITPVLSAQQPSSPQSAPAEKTHVLPETTTLEQPLTTGLLAGACPPRISRRAFLLGLGGSVAVAAVVGSSAFLLSHVGGTGESPASSQIPHKTGTALYIYRGHRGSVWDAAWSPDARSIASASADKTVQVWDAAGAGTLYTYTGHADSVYAVAWSPDGGRIASASFDKTVQVWDATGGNPFTYSGHSSWVWSVAWSPNGRYIASAGGDKTVQVWNAANGKPLHTYKGHTGPVFSVAWSPDSQFIASTGADGTVQVWKASDGSPIFTYQPTSAALFWSVSWSPDGKRIASASSDKTVQVWDAASGDHLYVYYGQSDAVYTAAWSPGGVRIASAGQDKTAQIWNAADGSNVFTYSGHTDAVRSVSWSHDGRRVASASWDKTVQIWRAQ